MSNMFNVAVVGATGVVGEAMMSILAERNFPVRNLYPLASERSSGKTVEFRGQLHQVGNLAEFDFSKADIGLFSAGAGVSQTFAPVAAQAGCVVVDNSSQFRYDDDIPLIVPEVNLGAMADYRERNIIANPKLLHHSTGGCLEANPPGCRHRTDQRCDLPGGIGYRPQSHRRVAPADPSGTGRRGTQL